jgi:HD-GYP domain-containing protein (c-di-GMP phosphodiesterase class II)
VTIDVVAPASAALQIKKLEDELKSRHSAITCAMMRVLDLRDIDTGVHSTRLAEWAVRIGERLGVSEKQLADIETASLLHDIGKVGIADSILHKPGPLTPSEYDELRKHPEFGWAILHTIPGFEVAALFILHHHERIDGRGYPAGIRGDDIPIGARIVAIVDAFDAMVSKRCYREALPVEEALRRLHASTGTQFDEAIVTEFAKIATAELDVIASISAGR